MGELMESLRGIEVKRNRKRLKKKKGNWLDVGAERNI